MKIFVDTSAWLALNDRNDQYYKKAVANSSRIKKDRIDLITSEYILDETITIIRYRVSHQAAVIFGESMSGSRIVRIEDITEGHRLKAWEMFKKYEDKELSFTDCTSFVLMKHFKLNKAFTFDDHFRQMGYEIF